MGEQMTSEAGAHLGEHIVCICGDDSRRLDLIASTFRAGTDLGCRCIYLFGRLSGREALAGLAARGCDTEGATSAGQLSLASAEEMYLAPGWFDPDRMLDVWVDLYIRTRRDGFEGLCAAGDPSWLARGVRGAERWLEYEARLNGLDVDPSRVSIICEYGDSDLPSSVYEELAKAHPRICRGDGVSASPTFTYDADHLPDVPLLEQLDAPADRAPCPSITDLLSAYADGELPAGRRHEVARHVGACTACAARVRDVLALKEAFQSLRVPADAPDALWAAVQEQLGRETPGSEPPKP
jgi:MEDS: MEthanogen/methylotroph, DcmR Sensory domain/Putative zinc-finger